ncbi:MAG: peptidoglycan DD-metalloendopeptidase family protein [Rhodospirillales bacterium]|jgi:murein DD-endopeptidase MepM/ murein hydrolase activator NlpD
MMVNLNPSTIWYSGVGAVLGAAIALGSQVSSPSGSGLATERAGSASTDIGIRTAKDALSILPIKISSKAVPVFDKSEIVVGSGDTLLALLQKKKIPNAEAHAAVSALNKVFDPRDIRVGQKIVVSANTQSKATALDAIRITVGPGHDVLATRKTDNQFVAMALRAETSIENRAFAGTITSSLYKAAISKGVPAPVLVDMIKLFSYDVDFQRDIRRNDSFELMFNRRITEDGLVVANSDIAYASMTLRGKTFKIYAFEHTAGETDYYTEQGKGTRKALMRTPINGARLSSSFGRRKHPVLGYTKMHRGVDFAAPRGTPIYAAGDGVIEKRQRWSSFGNYIRIRHGEGFATAYAHMKSFSKGYSVGNRVKQGAVIGYVGTTGRSTGPHLHYEVFKNGGQVNPMKVRFPASKSLTGKELVAFQGARSETDLLWVSVTSQKNIASLTKKADERSVE